MVRSFFWCMEMIISCKLFLTVMNTKKCSKLSFSVHQYIITLSSSVLLKQTKDFFNDLLVGLNRLAMFFFSNLNEFLFPKE